MNKVLLTGRLGRDAELSYTPNGKAVTRISVCTSESKKNSDGSYENVNEQWHKVTVWDKLAEQCASLRKGQEVFVDGYLRYTEKDGKKYTEINSFYVRGLSKFDAVTQSQSAETPVAQPSGGGGGDPMDDLPF